MADETTSRDLLGLAPYGESIKILSQGLVDGASTFLGKICSPAAEELGLIFRDRLRFYRTVQAVQILAKAEVKLKSKNQDGRRVHPRIAGAVIEHGSWTDDDQVQEMWAGLLSSGCTEDGRDDGNMMFVDLLNRLNSSQARLVKWICEYCPKICSPLGLVTAQFVNIPVASLFAAAGHEDFQRLDREVDHLRALDLIDGGLDPEAVTPVCEGTAPTSLALNLYIRCSGSRAAPAEFFGLTVPNSCNVSSASPAQG
jgi:hypothetical protein